MNIIETKKLTKTYHRFQKEEGLRGSIKSLFKRVKIEKKAVNEFDLSIREGEFVALIGPNAAFYVLNKFTYNKLRVKYDGVGI